MDSSLTNLNQSIMQLTTQIKEEKRKLDQSNIDAREVLELQVASVDERLASIESDLSDNIAEVAELEIQKGEIDREGREADVKVKQLRQDGSGAAQHIDLLKRQKVDQYAGLGRNLANVWKQVDKEQWHGCKPAGPLGKFVTLKDRRWASVLQIVLGKTMFAWAVSDSRDRAKLIKILEASGK